MKWLKRAGLLYAAFMLCAFIWAIGEILLGHGDEQVPTFLLWASLPFMAGCVGYVVVGGGFLLYEAWRDA